MTLTGSMLYYLFVLNWWFLCMNIIIVAHVLHFIIFWSNFHQPAGIFLRAVKYEIFDQKSREPGVLGRTKVVVTQISGRIKTYIRLTYDCNEIFPLKFCLLNPESRLSRCDFENRAFFELHIIETLLYFVMSFLCGD